MIGFANQKFKELTGDYLVYQPNAGQWPVLQKAQQIGCLSYVDLAFAEFLLKDTVNINELTAAFLCHLSRAVREGHLCIIKRKSELFPSPHSLWFSDVISDETCEIRELLDDLIKEEIILPKELLTNVNETMDSCPITPLCRYNDYYYFQKYWLFETSFSETLNSILNQNPELILNENYVAGAVQLMSERNQLNFEQANAIQNACQNCFSIICGGPGTGKTYTAGHLIRIFWDSLSSSQKGKCKIALAAPTGKAANNLQKSLEKAFIDRNDVKGAMKAKTLHSLLDVKISGKIAQAPNIKLNADLVLVDESSMIDVRLISYLLASIKKGARLILLGDPHQLPPVEVGSVFNDVIKVLESKTKNHVFKLKTCLRAELMEIIEFSKLLNDGDSEGVINHLNLEDNDRAVRRVKIPSDAKPRQVLESILEYAQSNIPKCSEAQDPTELLESFNKFRLLSPLRKGPFGVMEINRLIHKQRLSQVSWGDYIISPIIIVTNDYKMNLFNGEVGVLLSRNNNSDIFQKGDFAIFSGDGDAKYRKIPAILLPAYEYSYCLSVHKSQGSEFDHVLLLLPEGSERFGREVFYTAVTRAKKRLEVWGSDNTLRQTTHNKSGRLSGITQRKL